MPTEPLGRSFGFLGPLASVGRRSKRRVLPRPPKLGQAHHWRPATSTPTSVGRRPGALPDQGLVSGEAFCRCKQPDQRCRPGGETEAGEGLQVERRPKY